MIDLSQMTIQKSKRRTIALHIQPDGTLMVKAPTFTPDFFIRQFVRQHQAWIDKHMPKVITKKHPGKRTYQGGEVFLYLGKQYTLKFDNHKSLEFKEPYIHFPEYLKFRVRKEILEWYRQQARRIITELAESNAGKMGVHYTEIYFSDTKSKWGSCSPDNRLQFNIRLVMAPLLVINYVVIHELVHVLEKNHSRAFWHKVGLYTPSYRQQIKWLKDHGFELMTAF